MIFQSGYPEIMVLKGVLPGAWKPAGRLIPIRTWEISGFKRAVAPVCLRAGSERGERFTKVYTFSTKN